MTWTPVSFGKYRGKTLPQILFTDPDWFFWAIEKDAFAGKHPPSEVREIAHKAERIKVPSSHSKYSLVEYVVHPQVHKLADVRIVPKNQPQHQGGSPTYCLSYFDLSKARSLTPYDKMGGKIIVGAVKEYYFGSRSFRMTKKRCEDFFDNPSFFA